MYRRLATLLLLLTTSPLAAQLTALPNSGCRNASPVGPPIFAAGGAAPTVGNLSFAIQYACPAAAFSAFVVFGSCPPVGPLANWDLTHNCFSIWPSPPASCGMGFQSVGWIDLATLSAGILTYPLPIPNVPSLPALMQATPLCMQVVCATISATPTVSITCVEVSAGAQLIAQ